ncbi:MAG TPA: zf-HC2 domain-containing protein [Pilimelia sp.]|nr:zf-HC2 domain-containing protein [Pilimelia sp.]
MNRSGAIHQDVAAYALGVLDPVDAARFEDHLAICDICAMELESLLPVSALLAQVDGESFIEMEDTVREGRMLDEMVNAVAYDRSRRRARRLFGLAAGVVAFLVIGVASLMAGLTVGDAGQPSAQPAPSNDIIKPGGPDAPAGPGIGGFNDLPGHHVRNTDPTTKVQADVVLQDQDWGTQVSLMLAQVRGPLTCQLVVVGADGLGEVVYTWRVPAHGYGTTDHGEPLFLQGATAVSRADIDRLEVQSVDDAGRTALLVQVEA